jgi:hypothetical protein
MEEGEIKKMYEPSGLIFHDHSIISLPYAAACEAV